MTDREMREREWNPGDGGILPEVPESCYPPGAVPLQPATTGLCTLCGNVRGSDDSLCDVCVRELS